ncbi:MAG TPA: M14-type cytosolic carboxypeptidase [Prosthecobacter sp.]
MMRRRLSLLPFALVLLSPAAAAFAALSVHTNFEGGSARVVKLDPESRTVTIMPGGDSTRGWACWWALRLEGLEAGQKVTLKLLPSDQRQHQSTAGKGNPPLSASWSRPLHPSLSKDGSTWTYGAAGKVEGDKMVYSITPETASLWVAWGPLFTGTTGSALIDRLARQHPSWVTPFTLATTREGRPVPAMRIAAGEGKPVVWLQARQHAWESGASVVGEGVVQWLLSEEPLARQLRETAEIVFVPVMDVDHVATGDGGKDALPQDHNRDWKDEPHWPEVAAAQKQMLAYAAQGRLKVFCDLHNPAPGDKKAFFFVTPKDLIGEPAWESQKHFIELTRRAFAGNPIPLEITPRESGTSYHPLWRQISKNWVHEKCGKDILSLTLETPWNTPVSTVEGYHKTGACLGRALAGYLAPK